VADFKLSLGVDLDMSSRITGLAASQAITVIFNRDSDRAARVTLSPVVHALKYDFVLLNSALQCYYRNHQMRKQKGKNKNNQKIKTILKVTKNKKKKKKT
jgi:hypothetical protein